MSEIPTKTFHEWWKNDFRRINKFWNPLRNCSVAYCEIYWWRVKSEIWDHEPFLIHFSPFYNLCNEEPSDQSFNEHVRKKNTQINENKKWCHFFSFAIELSSTREFSCFLDFASHYISRHRLCCWKHFFDCLKWRKTQYLDNPRIILCPVYIGYTLTKPSILVVNSNANSRAGCVYIILINREERARKQPHNSDTTVPHSFALIRNRLEIASFFPLWNQIKCLHVCERAAHTIFFFAKKKGQTTAEIRKMYTYDSLFEFVFRTWAQSWREITIL